MSASNHDSSRGIDNIYIPTPMCSESVPPPSLLFTVGMVPPMDGPPLHPLGAPVAPPTAEASDHPDQYVPEIVRSTFLPHFYMKFKEKVCSCWQLAESEWLILGPLSYIMTEPSITDV